MDYFSKALGSLNIGLPFSVVDEPRIVVNGREVTAAVWRKDSAAVSVLSYALKDGNDSAMGRNTTAILRRTRLPHVAKLVDSSETFEHQNIIVERISLLDCSRLTDVAAKYVLHIILTTLITLRDVAQVVYNQKITEAAIGADGLPLLVVFDQARPGTGQSPVLTKDEFGSLVDLVCAAHPALRSKVRATSTTQDFVQLKTVLQTPLADLMAEMDRLMLLGPAELERVCAKIEQLSEHIWPELIMGAVLPPLIRTKSPVVLRTLLKLLTMLPSDEASVSKLGQHATHPEILEYIGAQFGNLDRVVRLELLKGLPNYVTLLPASYVQSKIMPKMAFGFVDSEVVVRRASVAAVISLAPKLTSRQLNSELLRLLAKTHSDSDIDVRALTTAVLCKISALLSNQSVVSTALGRALRDPSAKCRAAALQGVMDIDLPAKEVAEKLLAPAASGMLDRDPQVSADAWRVTNALMAKIQSAATASAPSTEQKDTDTSVDRIVFDALPERTLNQAITESPHARMDNKAPSPSVNTAASTKPVSGFGSVGASANDTRASCEDVESLEDVDEAWGWDEDTVEPEEQDAAEVDDAWGWDE